MQAAARETSAGLQLASGKGIGPANMSAVWSPLVLCIGSSPTIS